MREYHGADCNKTLTPLESEFFKGLENQGVICQSIHWWGKGVQLMAVTPMIPNEKQTGPVSVGLWQSLN